MKEAKEKVFYQKYKIHLINGEVMDHMEEYYMPEDEMDLIEWFESAGDDEILAIGDRLLGYTYIPRRSIAYIAQDGVATIYLNKMDESEESENSKQ